MDLYIDTSKKERLAVALKNDGMTVAESILPSERQQAELLLPAIEDLLKKHGLSKNKISRVIVEPAGESFMALRIGIATANALGFALGIPVITPADVGKKVLAKPSLVRPHYDREPNISREKKRI